MKNSRKWRRTKSKKKIMRTFEKGRKKTRINKKLLKGGTDAEDAEEAAAIVHECLLEEEKNELIDQEHKTRCELENQKKIVFKTDCNPKPKNKYVFANCLEKKKGNGSKTKQGRVANIFAKILNFDRSIISTFYLFYMFYK